MLTFSPLKSCKLRFVQLSVRAFVTGPRVNIIHRPKLKKKNKMHVINSSTAKNQNYCLCILADNFDFQFRLQFYDKIYMYLFFNQACLVKHCAIV